VFRETRLIPDMSVKFSAGLANLRERTRRAGHAVASRLIAGVRDVTFARYVARFTHVPPSHCSSKICDYVIMPFDIVIEQINSVDRVDVPF